MGVVTTYGHKRAVYHQQSVKSESDTYYMFRYKLSKYLRIVAEGGN